MSIAKFHQFGLTRSELKNVQGGMLQQCRVCSFGGPSGDGGGCGSYSMSKADANALRDEMNASNDGYIYTSDCQ